MPSEPPASDRTDDAFNAYILALNCLAFEADSNRAEIRLASLGDRLVPKGIAHQHRYTRYLFEEFDGDVDRLLATAQVCRAHSREDSRGAPQRLAYLRATDLCERAAALVTEPAGADPGRRARIARHLLEEDPTPAEQPRYRLEWTVLLPAPQPFRTTCMRPLPLDWRGRLARQLRPAPVNVRECCWYHGGDWHQAVRTARRLLAGARRAGVQDLYEHAIAAAETDGVSGWQFEAVESLLNPADSIQIAVEAGTRERFYINGNHRAAALLEAGVRRTVAVAVD